MRIVNFILLLLCLLSLYFNIFFGGAILQSAPATVSGRKAVPSFEFILEAEGENREEKDENLEQMFETFYIGTENNFSSIKWKHGFARLWIIILAYFFARIAYRRIKNGLCE